MGRKVGRQRKVRGMLDKGLVNSEGDMRRDETQGVVVERKKNRGGNDDKIDKGSPHNVPPVLRLHLIRRRHRF